MKQQIRYKNYRSLLLLLGMLAVTVWGYGQRLEVEATFVPGGLPHFHKQGSPGNTVRRH